MGLVSIGDTLLDAHVVFFKAGGNLVGFILCHEALVNKDLTDSALLHALIVQQRVHLVRLEVSQRHCSFAKPQSVAMRVENVRDLGIAQPAPLSGDGPEGWALSPLPHQGINQLLVGHFPEIETVHAKLERDRWRAVRSCLWLVFPGDRPGSLPGRRF